MKKYIEPEVNIVKFQAKDVLATSEVVASPKSVKSYKSDKKGWGGWF